MLPIHRKRRAAQCRETAGGPAGARIDWFPTSIWRFNVVDHQMLNQKLMQLIEEERRRDPAGLGGRSTRLGWHSTDRLHDHPGCRSLSGYCTRTSPRSFVPIESIPRKLQ